MRAHKPWLITALLLALLPAPRAALADADAGAHERSVVRIGVLAHRGSEAALYAWRPTAAYLTRTIPGREFIVVPLTNSTIGPAVAQGHVDFVITNPGSYAALEAHHGVTRLLTLRNLRQGQSYTRFGAVIFTRADRTDIASLADLRGKSFMAVRPDAFGGYLMALREMRDAGLDPARDLAHVAFAGLPQDGIVFAVRNGVVDAGTVRTDTLERMAGEGLIALEDFKIINRQEAAGFPFLLSTRLYPEWAFARTARTNEELAHRVGTALLQLPSDGPEARASRSAGWTMPLDYTAVHELLRELRVAPYDSVEDIELGSLVRQYGYWLIVLALAVLLSVATALHILRINWQLRASQTRLISLTRELEHANHVLKQLSMQDGLTGLANHRYFEGALAREWARCDRERRPLSLLMTDIDHFSQHNDRHGHPAGDECLRQVAAALRASVCRPSDLLARYGGDAFAVLLPNTELAGARLVAERIRACVAKLRLEARDDALAHVTVSVGVATMVPDGDNDMHMLIEVADEALYQAKAAGRNRVVVRPGRTAPAEDELVPPH
ncbi:diguanylate cyclase [Ectothiorhodospiraceae bacterium 2226]|nr:diguanylate cyclase [Ectothiorhodospiraceae bacterium 2226]